jgi:hypothetical protein
MILYDLHCKDCGHGFEAWFRDSKSFDDQVAAGALACASCAGDRVEKAIMAPRLSPAARKEQQAPAAPDAPDAPVDKKAVMVAKKAREAMKELRRAVEENCDYVGNEFAEEARRIHYGETEERGIYGEASNEEHEKLRDEGIEAQRIPWIDRTEH